MALAGHDTAHLVFNVTSTATGRSGTLTGVVAGELIVAVLAIDGNTNTQDPSAYTVTLGSDTLSHIVSNTTTLNEGFSAIFSGVATASGDQTLSVTTPNSTRAMACNAFRITGFDTTTPHPNSGQTKPGSNSTSLTSPNGVTTAADGNAIIGGISIHGGDITGLAVGAADGSTTGQTGTDAFSDCEWGVAWDRTPTAASVTFAWTWTGSDRPGAAWVEVAEAAGGGGTATGTASGAGAASGVGAAIASAAGTASGVATATATGASVATATGAAAGIGAASGVASGAASAVGSSAGASTASAVGKSTVAASGSSAGAAGVTGWLGTGITWRGEPAYWRGQPATWREGVAGTGAGTAAGTSTVSAVGKATAAAAGSASGTSTASGSSAVAGAATGAAAGTSTASAVGGSIARAAGAASGAASISAVGSAIVATIGGASGVATVAGAGASVAVAVGSAAGIAIVSGVAPTGVTYITLASHNPPGFRAPGGQGSFRAIGGRN